MFYLMKNKILLGSVTKYFRFGHVSILQYLSAIYINGVMPLEVIVLPPVIIVGLFFIFYLFDKKYQFDEIKYLFF